MDNFRLLNVDIDHFRGYREHVSFDLNEGLDLTIFNGPNGYGKTTFFDAVEWAFTGELFRYNGADEDKKNSGVINFRPFSGFADVSVVFGNDQQRYTLTRKSKSEDSDYGLNRTSVTVFGEGIGTLTNIQQVYNFLDDILISDSYKNDIKFADVFCRYHLLTQDKMKNFVQGMKGSDRYSEIISLMGNERYLTYQDTFNRWIFQVKTSIKEAMSAKDELNTAAGILEDQVKSAPQINLGNFKDIDAYFNHIIGQYNLACLDSALVPFNQSKGEHFEANKHINTFTEYVMLQKNTISGKIMTTLKREETVKALALDNKTYISNLGEISKLEKLKKCFEEYKNIDYCIRNIEAWIINEHEKNTMEKKLKDASEKKQEANEFLMNFWKISSIIKNILSEGELNTDFTTFETASRAEQLINWSLSDKCQIPWNNIYIEIGLEPEKGLKIGDYIFTIDNLTGNHTVLSNDYKNSINLLREKARSVSAKAKESITQYKNIQNHKNEVETDIDRLGKLDNSLKQILKESLDYLEKQNDMNDGIQICPVCKSPFNRGVLPDQIKSQLMEQNDIIIEKTALCSKLAEEMDQVLREICTCQEHLKSAINEFNTALHEIDNYIRIAIEKFKHQEDHLNLEMQMLSGQLDTMEQEHKKFNTILEKYSIQSNNSLLSEELKRRIHTITENVNQLEYKIEDISNLDIDTEIRKLNKFNLLFEDTASKQGISKDEPEKDINGILAGLANDLKKFQKSESTIGTIEKQVIDIQNYYSTNDMVIKLEDLRGKIAAKQKEIDKDNLIIEKLNSISEASKKSVELMTSELLSQYAKNINKIYKRIYPHPRFREFEFKLNRTSRDNSKLNLLCFDRENISNEEDINCEQHLNKINPAYIFSSAQTNALALSIFLGMAFSQKCTTLNTIFMDDPIQNMDDFNVFAFIDILRSAFSEGISAKLKKQLVLSSHDEMVYRLLAKKFRFYNCGSFVFDDYDGFEPKITKRNIKAES